MPENFNWDDARDDMVVPTQRGIAVYVNPNNEIVIRQESADGADEDNFVFFHAEFVDKLIERLKQVAAEIGSGV